MESQVQLARRALLANEDQQDETVRLVPLVVPGVMALMAVLASALIRRL
jgi:hypothetical protein